MPKIQFQKQKKNDFQFHFLFSAFSSKKSYLITRKKIVEKKFFKLTRLPNAAQKQKKNEKCVIQKYVIYNIKFQKNFLHSQNPFF